MEIEYDNEVYTQQEDILKKYENKRNICQARTMNRTFVSKGDEIGVFR